MRGGPRRSHLGVLLLASQLLHVGLENIPPVTLAVLGLNVYLYMFPAVPLLQVVHVLMLCVDFCVTLSFYFLFYFFLPSACFNTHDKLYLCEQKELGEVIRFHRRL